MTDKTESRESGPAMCSHSGPGEDKDVQARRKAVAKIMAAGAVVAGSKLMPAQWTRPVTDAVILPAHAQATGPAAPPG